MNTPRVNLVVLRVVDIDRAAAFYQLLGFEFVKHAHGTGPQHYASDVDGFVFELYPATAEQRVSSSTRIGFAVANVDDAAAQLRAFPGARLITAPKDSEWGTSRRRRRSRWPSHRAWHGHRRRRIAPHPNGPTGRNFHFDSNAAGRPNGV